MTHNLTFRATARPPSFCHPFIPGDSVRRSIMLLLNASNGLLELHQDVLLGLRRQRTTSTNSPLARQKGGTVARPAIAFRSTAQPCRNINKRLLTS
jgi:hypothetical protein